MSQDNNTSDARRYFCNYTAATPMLNELQMEFGKQKTSCSETCNIFLWLERPAGNLASTNQTGARILHPVLSSALVSRTHL